VRASKTIPSIPTLPMMIPAQRLSGCGSPRRHEVSRNLPSPRAENVVLDPYSCIISSWDNERSSSNLSSGVSVDISAASKSVFHPFSRSCKGKGHIMGQEPLIRIARSKSVSRTECAMWRPPLPAPKAVTLAGSPLKSGICL
jgi:hypothetical protein